MTPKRYPKTIQVTLLEFAYIRLPKDPENGCSTSRIMKRYLDSQIKKNQVSDDQLWKNLPPTLRKYVIENYLSARTIEIVDQENLVEATQDFLDLLKKSTKVTPGLRELLEKDLKGSKEELKKMEAVYQKKTPVAFFEIRGGGFDPRYKLAWELPK